MLLAAAPVAAQHEQQLAARVTASLQRAADDVDGVVGYAIVGLKGGGRFERLADQPFPTASSIKIALLYELLRQADEGRLRLDEPRPLDARHRVGGSGILVQLSSPHLSLRDLAVLMMMLSDNSATNAVIDAVGLQAVNERMKALGLRTLALRRRMMDAEAARRGEENVSSPGDLVRLLQLVDRGEGLSEASRKAALDIMARPLDSALRRGVPGGVRVASKPGGLDGVRADAGIVYLDGQPFALAVMATFASDGAAAEAAITAITRSAFGFFDRVARAGTAGRLLPP